MMKMKCLLVLMVISAMSACTSPQKVSIYNEGVHIVPQPNSLKQNEGQFQLTAKTVFVVKQAEIESVVSFFQSKMKTATAYDLDLLKTNRAKNSITVLLNDKLETGEEGYVLSVTPDAVKLEGKTTKGVFYGLQTLLQLLPAEIESTQFVEDIKWSIPAVEIKDEPRFKWRGMHLDVCRHFVPVEDIKKHMDMMAMFKMNTFHWHLTEDQGWRIEIKKYPLLTEMGSKRIEGEGHEYGGFYTQDQIKDIVAYASERMIDVVPEIELPGHALAALVAYPEYSCTGGPFEVRKVWGVEADVYCAGKEETFELLEDIIDEVVALFPSPYFHIGGDECPKTRWEECPLCQKRMKQEGLADEHELQSYFVKRIEKILVAHGKKMIGWDEILEGGLAESAAVMSWRGEKGGIEAATHGHDVVMTPGNWCYLDHYQGSKEVEPVAIGGYTTLEESYSYEPVPEKLDAKMAKHILGTQGNVWTEYMYTPELIEYRVYPRIIALAEVNWTKKESKNFDDFLKRMDNQFVRMDLHDVNYHIPLPEGPFNQVAFIDSVKIEFTSTRPIKMLYTLDGTEPNSDSKVYTEPLHFSDDASINIASILLTGKMSKIRNIEVKKQTYLPASVLETLNKGLKEVYVKGDFIRVADIEKVKDWEARQSVELKNKWRSKAYKTPSASVFTGYIEIAEDGIYEFSTDIDQFYLGGQLLVNNDGEVKRYSRNNSSIALAKGKHEVKLIYLNNIIGGWPQSWGGPVVKMRQVGEEKFEKLTKANYSY